MISTGRRVLLGAVVAVLTMPVAGAEAGTVPINPFGRSGDLHLDFPTYVAPDPGTHMDPPEAQIRPVGDVSGDGRADLAMAISGSHASWETTTWVTFLPAALAWSGSVGDPGWSGLRIVGTGPQVTGIAGLGDVNGDGTGDIAIAGKSGAWVVFGGPATATVDVQRLGDRGFSIGTGRPCFNGGGGNGFTGVFTQETSVVGLGDQDGDGRADLAVCDDQGVHVIFTPSNPAGATVDLSGGRARHRLHHLRPLGHAGRPPPDAGRHRRRRA